jgi:poly(A) polymerase
VNKVNIKSKPRLHATWIEPQAREIVSRLQKAGFISYLVGGCVRDLLVGLHPKDYDIATSAQPEEIRKVIRGSHIIGRRFRLVLIRRGPHQFEVATFRRGSRPEDFVEGDDAPFGDNFFGSPEEDALRRDFTINALFYDSANDELIDYADGIKDIENRYIRIIGDPIVRIKEDPIRSLRALRLSHKLKFKIEPELRLSIQNSASELLTSALPRRREEYLKIMRLPEPIPIFLEMADLDILKYTLPSIARTIEENEKRDIFLDHFRAGISFVQNQDDPIENFMPLVFAFTRTWENEKDFETLRDQFIRQELGMFKAEISEVLSILELSKTFPDIKTFAKRGMRRKRSFFQQSIFPMAHRIAYFENRLTPHEEYFWREQYNYVMSPEVSTDSN